MLLTRDQMEVELCILRVICGTKFDELMNFLENEIQCWLVSFVKGNEDKSSTTQQRRDTLKTIEDELFGVRFKQDIIVVSLREYTQEWLKCALEAIANPP